MLAIIAGTGALPREIAAHLEEEPLICAMAGSEPDMVKQHLDFRIEQLGTFIKITKKLLQITKRQLRISNCATRFYLRMCLSSLNFPKITYYLIR